MFCLLVESCSRRALTWLLFVVVFPLGFPSHRRSAFFRPPIPCKVMIIVFMSTFVTFWTHTFVPSVFYSTEMPTVTALFLVFPFKVWYWYPVGLICHMAHSFLTGMYLGLPTVKAICLYLYQFSCSFVVSSSLSSLSALSNSSVWKSVYF